MEFDGAPKGLNEAPVAVDNKLYWYAQDDECLVGYDMVTKRWFLGSLHLHDHSDYVDRMNFMSHSPVRLAHLGGRGDQVVFACFGFQGVCPGLELWIWVQPNQKRVSDMVSPSLDS